MKIKIDYSSHTIDEEWEKTEYTCLMCAEREVYKDSGFGDYYQGPQYICISCGHEWCLPNGPSLVDKYDKQILDAIKKQL